MNFWRACDAVESAVAWKSVIEYKETPSCLIFSRQSLPHVERDETTVTDGWYKYLGTRGVVAGMSGFGESAPASDLFELFGLTGKKVLEATEKVSV